ncbi:hypothetical protein BD779DRAFT_1155107 [Infundibulicybe gibba]|nr:hypothetical protein BD779DRAFT_1155107 [Infundibulicybe gibba]
MQLPQELIDLCLDYLSEDTDSLKNCSLVGHSWMLGSRQHLFRRITLSLSCVFNTPGDHHVDLDRFELLHGIFKSAPQIAARVEAFTLSASQLSLGDQYAAFDSTLSCIVEALRNVETFTLCDVWWLGGFNRLTYSILSMLALPSIRSISFRQFSSSVLGLEPSKLLMLAPNLRRLHLERIQPPSIELPYSPLPNPTPIQSLSLSKRCSLAQFGWMLDARSPFDLRELRELRLGSWVTRVDTLFVERLLRIVGASLVHLELGQPPCVDRELTALAERVPLIFFLDSFRYQLPPCQPRSQPSKFEHFGCRIQFRCPLDVYISKPIRHIARFSTTRINSNRIRHFSWQPLARRLLPVGVGRRTLHTIRVPTAEKSHLLFS